MMDDDWTPPTEEEIKLIAARRARSDQISKLMSGYLLKGYKMLGSECHCGTILLQDRSGTKHCVACEELQCDTEKDDPALRPPGAPILTVKEEPRAPATPTTTPMAALTTSSSCSPRVASTSPRAPAQSPRIAATVPVEDGAEYLSMSSIDVHCWPSNPTDLGGGGDQAAATAKTNQTPRTTPRPCTANPLPTLAQGSSVLPHLPDSEDIASCVSVLQRKICWASGLLEQNSTVESSTELCKLIKAAAEAIVAVRKASI